MSLEAVQDSVIEVWPIPLVVRPVGVVGGVVSGQALVLSCGAGLGGAVAGCVGGVDGEGVAGAAGEAGEGVAGRGR